MERKFYLFALVHLFYIPFCFSQSFESSNLPIVTINTNGQAILDDPKIIADMGIIYNGEGQRNSLNDSPNAYNGKIGIEIRGSSSQSYPKKSYGFETRELNDPEEDIDVSLLGMPKESDWILYAPYSDKTMLRNVLAYHLANQLGWYASRTKYCELVLNGEYMGTYVLMEKIKRNKNRVDISKIGSSDNTGDNLTGGYLIKIDKFTGSGGDGFYSSYQPDPHPNNQNIFFQYEYPKEDKITSAQKTYIKDYISSFETTLKSKDFADTENGYRKYIHTKSFIDYFLINEVMGNVDGYRLSTFMYKDKDSKGGKLTIGPVWDYNISSGNADYCTGDSYSKFFYRFNQVCPQDYWLVPFWWEKLLKDELFANEMKCRWKNLRQNTLHLDTLYKFIDNQVTLLNETQQRNYQRWDILGKYVWPNRYLWKTYPEEIAYLKSWLKSRLQWLDENLPGKCGGLISQNRDPIITYPNPFRDELKVFFRDFENKTVKIELYDVQGRFVSRFSQLYEGQPLTMNLKNTGIQSGVYILKSFQSDVLIETRLCLRE